ncbi:MAG: alanine dehydrogenase [Chlamydiales bacterium]
MIIGIPKEIKIHEYRVGATPNKVQLLTDSGHQVLVQKDAAIEIGFPDEMYVAAGAKIVPTAKEVYEAELIIKVKEPQPEEFPLLKKGQTLFCYLHLAPDAKQTEALVKSGVTAIAYETVFDSLGRLPLLTPMSELAGRIAIQAGATALQMAYGGKGVLLGGVPGVLPGKVVVIGGGVVGTHAARMAMGLGADVTVLDRDLNRLRDIDVDFNFRMKTLFSSPQNLVKVLKHADLVVGAVLIPGKSAPRLVTKEMLKKMEKGSVLVDVAIDQGGCFETSRPTTHSDPLYEVDGIVHYCVTNMPGACAKTATEALTSATIPYTQKLVEMGVKQALLSDEGFLQGLNVCNGQVTNKHVAADLDYTYLQPKQALG